MAETSVASSDQSTNNLLSISFNTRELLALVRDNKHLWQVTHPGFRNTQLREKTWYDIARQLDSSFDLLDETEQKCSLVDLVKRWKSVRNSFFHSLRCESERPYVYENELKFLLPRFGVLQHVPIKVENLSDISGEGNESDSNQTAEFHREVAEDHNHEASTPPQPKIKSEICDSAEGLEESGNTDGKASQQASVDDAAAVGESNLKPRKRKKVNLHKKPEKRIKETHLALDVMATPRRRPVNGTAEVGKKKLGKKTVKESPTNSEKEATPQTPAADTVKVGQHKAQNNKTRKVSGCETTLQNSVDEAEEFVHQNPTEIIKESSKNSERKATLQSSVDDSAKVSHISNCEGRKTEDVDQAFFDKIKSRVRNLSEDRKFSFRIEVMQLLQGIKNRRSVVNSTQDSNIY